MKITADTNLLVRAAIGDDQKQARAAAAMLSKATLVAVSTAALCEFVWVLRRLYRFERDEIVAALRALTEAANVEVDEPAAAAGLAMLEAGGDFADGVMAFEGQRLGGETFVSFDKKAVTRLSKLGVKAQLL
ncbi:type II toxin-antitoxin system VapC family toxin [Methylocystis bryophila]|uniref:VapC toxin family PIN domain ribonuclease n=1 Tax=Methylocystis bryophila TaxID=655015 RepID=A0A1W6MV23_9HYPH|nr:type II toxin-antitoxin system VapC family toxin [Methylocystis bryophila]ARN81435.1 VapC toxin family PIN domain ribonuclease [Methylocystis bryophila]BDV37439.1 DNA-binding protein [Methylocystis bryophila]